MIFDEWFKQFDPRSLYFGKTHMRKCWMDAQRFEREEAIKVCEEMHAVCADPLIKEALRMCIKSIGNTGEKAN